MVRQPSTIVIGRSYSKNHSPTPPIRAPKETKTKENPSTNSSDPASIRPRLASAEVGAGEPGRVGEVARQQRHHAGREERDQAGDQGHRDGQHERTVERRVAEPVTQVERGHFCTSRTRSTRVCCARHLTQDAGGHPALLVEDHRARDRAGVERAAEGEQGAPGGVEEGRVGHVVAALEGEALVRAGVLGVHADELHVVGLELPRGLAEEAGLLAARRAPRPPDVEYDDLAGVLVQGELLAVQRGPGDLAGLLAVGRGQAGDQALPGDVPLVAGAGTATARGGDRAHEEHGEEKTQRGTHLRPGAQGWARSGGPEGGWCSSSAPPAEKGAPRSASGIRSPAGSE